MSGRWKNVERQIAKKYLNGTRIPVLGKMDRDIDDGYGLWCDVKSRQTISKAYARWLCVAKNTGYDGVLQDELAYLPVNNFIKKSRFLTTSVKLPRLASVWLDHIALSVQEDRLPCVVLHLPGADYKDSVIVFNYAKYVMHRWDHYVLLSQPTVSLK